MTPGSWLVLAAGTEARVLADEFAAQWTSPDRRVLTAGLCEEAAVLAAFEATRADADRPPAGVVVFLGASPSGPGEGVTCAMDAVWSIATTVRAIVGGWQGRAPRLWLVTRQGL
ncbi:MAG: hypothetical protein JOZ49_18195, partial [Mycolicibacterium sp.]|nr:hypothetical protein [Mycolicibacterium sp.]